MAMKNFKLIIEYDGTGFNGWQVQTGGRTVQGEIEKALSRMAGRHVRIAGSGRTDAGVHALGQVANFRCDTHLSAEVFFSGLNSLLPDDIVIHSCESVPEEFHARFDALGKTYHYRIINRMLPPAIGRQYAWWLRKPLDRDAMRHALPHITGTHDFKAFENVGSPRAHSIRTVFDAALETDATGHELTLRITANGFLRNMVRNIVGTLVEVGRLTLTPEDVAILREGKNRGDTPATAPPHGLFLMRVDYGNQSMKTPDVNIIPPIAEGIKNHEEP